MPHHFLLTLSAGSQWGGLSQPVHGGGRPGPQLPPPPTPPPSLAITARDHNSITRNTGQNHELQRFISAIQGLYLGEGSLRGGERGERR